MAVPPERMAAAPLPLQCLPAAKKAESTLVLPTTLGRSNPGRRACELRPGPCPAPQDGNKVEADHGFASALLLPPPARAAPQDLEPQSPQRRLVPLRCGVASPSLHEPPSPSSTWATGCTSNAPIPASLHICAESRAEAFKNFGRAFGFARGPGQVIFNPHSDVLFFGPRDGYMAADSQFHTFMSMCDPEELARVRYVAMSDSLFWIDNIYRSMTAASLTVAVIKQVAMRMPALERIIFVPRTEDEAGDLTVVVERMAHQIQMAVASVCQQLPNWTPPPREIVSTGWLSSIGG